MSNDDASMTKGVLLEEMVEEKKWLTWVSTNSLKEVAGFHLGIRVDKEDRNVFVKGDLDQIKEKFNDLMGYCANDVLVTGKVYQKLFPMYEKKCPNAITFAGMLEMGNGFLPVNQEW